MPTTAVAVDEALRDLTIRTGVVAHILVRDEDDRVVGVLRRRQHEIRCTPLLRAAATHGAVHAVILHHAHIMAHPLEDPLDALVLGRGMM